MWARFLTLLTLVSSQMCSDSNCLDCEIYLGEEFCRLCTDGLFPSFSGCFTCESQPMECDLSSSKWSCFCSSTLSLGTFEPNPSLSSHCIEGQPCQICFEGYFYENESCLSSTTRKTTSCPTNCNTCGSDGVCTLCNWGYGIISTPNVCQKCENGYYPVTGGCGQCYSRCSKCDWYELCTGCVSGDAPINGYCCPAGCSSCNLSKCWGCNSGYLYDGTNCNTCPSNCNGCPNGVCATSNGCPLNCETCTSSTSCSKCESGFYPVTGGCDRCFSQCTTCDWHEVCTGCVSGDAPINGYCCPAGCSSCNLSKCWGCNSGYLYDGTNCNACPSNCNGCPNGVCVTSTGCPLNCETCTSSNSCTKCNSGFYPVIGGCDRCFTQCTTCDWYEVCTACVSGDAPINGYCCPAGCSSCNLSKCWGCSSGYLYDGTNCNTCPSNCNGCPNGFCLTSTGCPLNCETCTSPTSCSKCESGFYPVTGGCERCVSTCTTCDWKEVCTGCVSGLNLVDNYCCSPRCKSCNHLVCHECNPGYDEINGVCENCAVNCGGCPFGICQLTCPTGCSTCTKTTCTACKDGFFMSSGVCTACNPKCKTCTALNRCTSCFANYYIASSTVKKCCLEGCADCNMSNDRCLSCHSGYSYISATRKCVAA